MKAFAELLDRLAYTPARNDKLRLLADYFATTPDPDRGYALAALTDGLFFRLPLRRILSDLLVPRVDPVLFDLSRDYVGDTAETIALIWPAKALLLAGFFLLALQGISEIIKKIAIMRGRMDDPNPFISAHEQAELDAKALADEVRA